MDPRSDQPLHRPRDDAARAAHTRVTGSVLAHSVVTPGTLAAFNLNSGPGDPYVGAQDLAESYLFRPLPAQPSHRTFVPNLHTVGASTWPSGGVPGASGYIVAQQLLANLGRTDRPGSGPVRRHIPSPTPQGNAMSQENVRLVEQVAAFHTSHDIEKLLALFAEDVLFEDVALGVVAQGRDELKGLFEGTWAALHGFAMTLQSVGADEGRGSAEWVLSGKHDGDFPGFPASGKLISVRVGAIMRFADGHISHWNDYWSLATLKEQIGAA